MHRGLIPFPDVLGFSVSIKSDTGVEISFPFFSSISFFFVDCKASVSVRESFSLPLETDESDKLSSEFSDGLLSPC